MTKEEWTAVIFDRLGPSRFSRGDAEYDGAVASLYSDFLRLESALRTEHDKAVRLEERIRMVLSTPGIETKEDDGDFWHGWNRCLAGIKGRLEG